MAFPNEALLLPSPMTTTAEPKQSARERLEAAKTLLLEIIASGEDWQEGGLKRETRLPQSILRAAVTWQSLYYLPQVLSACCDPAEHCTLGRQWTGWWQ